MSASEKRVLGFSLSIVGEDRQFQITIGLVNGDPCTSELIDTAIDQLRVLAYSEVLGDLPPKRPDVSVSVTVQAFGIDQAADPDFPGRYFLRSAPGETS